ncbi:mitochondrial division protein 1 isoform X2 [Populus alba x Populus x berolinensis]|nr:mitochondrial division protein 1 isoform X2 [Populus alba x Populus x berolinensis]
MLFKAASFNCTIWTADCNPNSSTNLGAALVNLETGMESWVCRSKSDVLSQQLDPSRNVVLCGLINGAILTVDVREKQEMVSDRLIRHRIPYSSLGRQGPSSSKQWFEVFNPLDMINFAGTKFVAR